MSRALRVGAALVDAVHARGESASLAPSADGTARVDVTVEVALDAHDTALVLTLRDRASDASPGPGARPLPGLAVTLQPRGARVAARDEAAARTSRLRAALSMLEALAVEADTPRPLATRTAEADAARVRAAEQFARSTPMPLVAPPACLEPAVRPPHPGPAPAVESSAALGGPCGACVLGASCLVAPHVATGDLAHAGPVAPIRAPDEATAVRAALGALEAALGPAPVSMQAFTSAALARRPHRSSPREASLKVHNGRLERRIRFVDYGPGDGRVSLAARRDTVRRLLEVAVGAVRATALDTALDPLLGVLRHTRTLSVGLDAACLDAACRGAAGAESAPGAIDDRAQVYLHVDPRDAAPGRLAEALRLLFGTASLDAVDAAQHADALAAPGEAAGVALLALADGADGAFAAKVYVAQPPTAYHASRSGPHGTDPEGREASWLAPFVPAVGLHVVEAAAFGIAPRKWDAPSAVHPRHLDRIEAAFVAGLADEDARAVARALHDPGFTAWPTWLSAGDGSRALYYVPR